MIRLLLTLILTLLISGFAWAEEKIIRYDVSIDVQQDADFIVRESISVISEGRKIRRGIFRDLPRFKMAEDAKIPYQYKILSITRNGNTEPYSTQSDGNAKQYRIGDPDYFLPRGQHDYVITYEVKNEVRYFDDFDEVYWNAIGTYWNFPMDVVTTTVNFPSAIAPLELNCYTGAYGSSASECKMSRDAETFYIEALNPLKAREGMAISIKFNKGIIDPPSQADKNMLWWFKNGALALLTFSFIGLFGYYYRAWNKVGRDPVKDPVFARYVPPEGYSPAAVHHVFYKGLRGHKALIATLLDLSVKGRITLDSHKKTTTIAMTPGIAIHDKSLSVMEHNLEKDIFSRDSEITLKGKYNVTFTKAYQRFRKKVTKDYGKDYFQWNAGFTIIGIVLSVFAVVAAFTQFYGNNSGAFFLVLGALALMNILFVFLMPAPTDKGQRVRTEIEGFKLYLETAEKQRLNAVEIGTDRPPPMTMKRYEQFLPYAIALDVEKPWTKHFEKVLPEEAKNYDPSWTNMRAGDFGSIGGMSKALTSNLSSGVSSSMPQSSSSSGGSSGGGFSGGGGGGGGGGGW